jgi:putative methyltransferase (TIGR04325 family)
LDELAPITLFTYNRPRHARQTIESLAKNELASESEIFIFSDGGKNDEDWNKVQEVRRYLKAISGFKKIEIFENEYNKGLANSIIDGVTKIVNKYGRIIVLEDDMITSQYFLRYMNDALGMYENDDAVACIAGYVYPIENLPETFFIKGGDCWGWATWENSWSLFEADGKKLLNELESRHLEDEFDVHSSYQYTQMLMDQINGKNNSWAIRWYASLFLKDKLCLHPQKSFVRNIGCDASGVHCESTDLLDVQLVASYKKIKKIPVSESAECRKSFELFFKKTLRHVPENECKGAFKSVLKKICRRANEWSFFKKTGTSVATNDCHSRQYGFFGDYLSWEEAEALSCGGYERNNILGVTLASTLKVKNGEAVFERDSVVFDEIQYSFGMLASLQKVAIENGNSLKVLDFGGALGSHYFQNKEFLKPIAIKKWVVVEQEHYVKTGKEKIADGVLDFAYSIDEIVEANALIASSVIQYLDMSYKWLKKLVDKGIPYMIFDRTAFSLENRDRLTLQKVPPEIYEASYPAWFLDEQKFLNVVSTKYEILAEFDDHIDIVDEIPSKYKGFLFKLRE